MKKCILAIIINDSDQFESVDDTCVTIRMTNGKLIVPVIEIEKETIQELKQAVDKTVTKTFEKQLKC